MIKQLSVFVENRPGNIMRVTSALNEANINIRAIASYDTPEFGILRLVVDQNEEARDFLTHKGFVVRIQNIVGVALKDERGSLNHMLEVLKNGNINIDYIYSFVLRDDKSPVIVFHADDCERAEQLLKDAGLVVE